MKESTHQHLEGELLDERYRVLRLIGMGGMGVVYEGIQEQLKRRVALKILSPKRLTRHDPVKRFRREAESVAALSHPNVAQVFDLFVHDGLTVIAMEYIDGSSLSNILNVEGRLQPSRVISIALQILSALESTHAAHIVHRDLKPSNVMLAQVPGLGEWVKVVDFGIALMMEDTGVTRLTQGGEVLGTPAFMAPEQLLGGDIDIRTDIYSLGAVMFMTLSGRRPYQVKSFKELLEALTTKPAPTVEDLEPFAPVQLARVVVRALSKAPDNRFETPRKMTNALKTAPPMGVEEKGADVGRNLSNREPLRSPPDSPVSQQRVRKASNLPTSFDDVAAETVNLKRTMHPTNPRVGPVQETIGSADGADLSLESVSSAMEASLPELRSSPSHDREPGDAASPTLSPRTRRVLPLLLLVIVIVIGLGSVGGVVAYQYFDHLASARPEQPRPIPTPETGAVTPLPAPKVLPGLPPPVLLPSSQPTQVVIPAGSLPNDRKMKFYLDRAISKAGEVLPGGRLTRIIGNRVDSSGRLSTREQRSTVYTEKGFWSFTFCNIDIREEVSIRYANDFSGMGRVSQEWSSNQTSSCNTALDAVNIRGHIPDSDRLIQYYSKSPGCTYRQNDLLILHYTEMNREPLVYIEVLSGTGTGRITVVMRDNGSLRTSEHCDGKRRRNANP